MMKSCVFFTYVMLLLFDVIILQKNPVIASSTLKKKEQTEEKNQHITFDIEHFLPRSIESYISDFNHVDSRPLSFGFAELGTISFQEAFKSELSPELQEMIDSIIKTEKHCSYPRIPLLPFSKVIYANLLHNTIYEIFDGKIKSELDLMKLNFMLKYLGDDTHNQFIKSLVSQTTNEFFTKIPVCLLSYFSSRNNNLVMTCEIIGFKMWQELCKIPKVESKYALKVMYGIETDEEGKILNKHTYEKLYISALKTSVQFVRSCLTQNLKKELNLSEQDTVDVTTLLLQLELPYTEAIIKQMLYEKNNSAILLVRVLLKLRCFLCLFDVLSHKIDIMRKRLVPSLSMLVTKDIVKFECAALFLLLMHIMEFIENLYD